MDIIKEMKSFEMIDFNEEDIVRSGLVKEYIISKNQKQYSGMFESIDKKMKRCA
jgi:phosphate starvation-inducible protein PhoH